MYCKQCGHRGPGKPLRCPKCDAVILSTVALTPTEKPRVRTTVPFLTIVIGIIVFVGLPKIFLRPELEPIGPTSKVRFLRALDHSQYRQIGLHACHVDAQTLELTWDQRWGTLAESKQQEIVRNVGRAWKLAGGEDT